MNLNIVAVKLNPKLLDRLNENVVTEEIVNIAIDRGYVISNSTPLYLLKYSNFCDLYFSNLDRKYELYELRYLMMDISLCSKYLKNIHLFDYDVEELQELLHILGTNILFIPIEEIRKNKSFILAYIDADKSLDILNTFNFLEDAIDDYESFYFLLKKHNLSLDRRKYNQSLFEVSLKDNINNLYLDYTNSFCVDDKTTEIVLKYIKINNISCSNFKNTNFINSIKIFKYYVEKDFSNIQYFSKINIPFIGEFEYIVDLFIKSIPLSLDYFSIMTNVVYETMNESVINKLIEALEINHYQVRNCEWNCVNTSLYVEKQILDNPAIINELNLNSNKFDAKFIEKLVDKINTDGIVINQCNNLKLNTNFKFILAVLNNNPYYIDRFNDIFFTKHQKEEIDKLLVEKKYKLSTSSSYFALCLPNLVVESLKNDLSILNNIKVVFRFGSNYNFYDVLKCHNYQISSDSPDWVFKIRDLVIEGLNNKTITLQDVNLKSGYWDQDVEFCQYLIGNYTREELDTIGFSHLLHYSDDNFLLDKLYRELEDDFSKCTLYYNSMYRFSSKKYYYQAKIRDLFFNNLENNIKYLKDSEILKDDTELLIRLYRDYNYDISEYLDNLNNSSLYDALNPVVIKKISEGEKINSKIANAFLFKNKDLLLDFYYKNLDQIGGITTVLTVLGDEGFELFMKHINDDEIHFDTIDDFEIAKRVVDEQLSSDGKCNFSMIKNESYIREKIDLVFNKLLEGNLEVSNNIRFIFDELSFEQCKKLIGNSYNYYRYLLWTNPNFKQLKDSVALVRTENKSLKDLINIIDTDFSLVTSIMDSKEFQRILDKTKIENPEEYDSLYNELITKVRNIFIQGKEKKYMLENLFDLLFFEYSDDDLIKIINDNNILSMVDYRPSILKDENILEKFINYSKLSCDISKKIYEYNKNFLMKIIQYKYKGEQKDKLCYCEAIECLSDEEVYDVWVSCECPFSSEFLFNSIGFNKYIILHLLKENILNCKYYGTKYEIILEYEKLKELEKEVFEIFSNNLDKVSLYDSSLFSCNSLIIERYLNFDNIRYCYETFIYIKENIDSISDEDAIKCINSDSRFASLFMDREEIKKYLISSKFIVDERFFSIYPDADLLKYRELLDISFSNNRLKTIHILAKYFSEGSINDYSLFEDYCNRCDEFYFTEDFPSKIFDNKELVLKSIKNNPDTLLLFGKINFSEEEIQLIMDNVNIDELAYDFRLPLFILSNSSFVKKKLLEDISMIDKLSTVCLSCNDRCEIIKVVKKAIKDGTYKLSLYSPDWLFSDTELKRRFFIEVEGADNEYNLTKLLLTDYKYFFDNNIVINNNPYVLLFNILEDISLVDVLEIKDIIYPKELIDSVVKKMIDNNYVVSDKTPKVFMTDELLYYAIKNNMKINDIYIESFFTFENMYLIKDKELFIDLINRGYGKKYNYYFNLFGIDKTIDLAMKYGCLLVDVDFTSQDDDINELIFNFAHKSFNKVLLLLAILRCDRDLSDNEIKNTIYNHNYSSKQIDELFKCLIVKKPERVKLYLGCNESIFQLAIDCGFEYNIDDYEKKESFNNSIIVSKIMIDKDVNNLFKYKGNSDEVFKYAKEKGFIFSLDNYIKQVDFRLSKYFTIEVLKNDSRAICHYLGNDISIYELAINEYGYKINLEDLSKFERLRNIDYIFSYALDNKLFDVNRLIKYYDGFDSVVISKFIENNYISNREDFERNTDLGYSDELMRYSLNIDNKFIVYYLGNDIGMYDLAIEKGYVPTLEDLHNNEKLGSVDSLFKVILNHKLVDLLPYYIGANREYIANAYRILLGDKYDSIIKNDNDLKNYISIWITGSFNNYLSHKRLVSYMDSKVIDLLKSIKLDYYLVLKYGINNNKMDNFINLIDDNQLDKVGELYNKIIENNIVISNNSFGVDLFLKVVRLCDNYPDLVNELISKEINDGHISCLVKLLNSNEKYSYIVDLKSLESFDNILIENVTKALDFDNVIEVKDAILKYVVNMNYIEFKDLLENHINYDTVDKILKKAIKNKNQELIKEAVLLKTMLSMLEDTVNSSNDLSDLKKLLSKFLDNNDLVDKVRPIFYDIKERVRNIYELDANNSLIDFSKIEDDKIVYSSNGQKIIDLSHSEYIIYAHCMSGTNYEDYVRQRFDGRVTICVSPISNLGKKLYSSSGIILGFTNVPKGGFVGSSNVNMGSNGFIFENNYEVKDSRFYQLEIADSSSLTPVNHPETILYRDGLLPTCIIVREKEPNKEEMECKEKFLALGLDIPFVYTQEIGVVSDLSEQEMDNSIILSSEEKFGNLYLDTEVNIEKHDEQSGIDDRIEYLKQKLMELKNKLPDVKKAYVSDLIKMKIGGSHSMYKCHIADRDGIYYLKPGVRKEGKAIDPYRSYAMKCSYEIQKIVNPENAVYVDLVYVPGTDLGLTTEDSVLCSIIEVIPETTSYDGWMNSDKELSQEEMKSFMREFIADYLLFSYDTKGENFLKDKNGHAYGIDKEQALKFILNDRFKKEDGYDVSFATSNSVDFNACNIIYHKIFEMIADGSQIVSKEVVDLCFESIDRIECMSDKEYLEIFKDYINEFSISSVCENLKYEYIQSGCTEDEAIENIKKDLCDSLLARKNGLSVEYSKYLYEYLVKGFNSRGEEIPEWVNKLSIQMSL